MIKRNIVIFFFYFNDAYYVFVVLILLSREGRCTHDINTGSL